MTYTYVNEEKKMAANSPATINNSTFASLFNLVSVSESIEQTIRCQELVRLVTEKFPCRVFQIQTDETSQGDFFHIEETVQTIGTEKNSVCFDEIIIESSPNQLKKAPYVILPKLLSDLPLYILLGHEPTQDTVIVPALQKYATRIVFDSHSMDSIQLFAARMLTTIQKARSDFVDIVWARTKGWREVLLRTFNDESKISHLRKSKTIQISYCCPATHSTSKLELQAVYLQAWLAAQLGWISTSVQKDENRIKISYKTADSALEVSLIAKDSEVLECGEIFSCEILTHSDNHYLISFEGQRSQVTVHASQPERCEMPYCLFMNNYQKGPALINEALYQSQSEHYSTMLGILCQEAWSKLHT